MIITENLFISEKAIESFEGRINDLKNDLMFDGISMGVVSFDPAYEKIDEVLKLADMKLYEDKKRSS